MISNDFSWKTEAGTPIFAREWAPESETRAAIGLVHGLGEHIGRYQHVAQQLTQAGYALVGFDLPGHGQSGGNRGFSSYDDISIEIDHLLAELGKRHPGKPRFLYGHSLGGVLVLYYCLKRQPVINGAVVTSPGLVPGQPVPPAKILLAKLMAKIMPSFSMSNGLDLENLSHDPAVIQAYRNDPLVHDQISARLGIDLLTQGEWILSQASEFPVPLLLMQGSADHIVSPSSVNRLAGIVPAEKLTYIVWEGFYHETHNEPEKDQVLQAMQDWLDRHV